MFVAEAQVPPVLVYLFAVKFFVYFAQLRAGAGCRLVGQINHIGRVLELFAVKIPHSFVYTFRKVH